ncbi:beta-lactamase, putative [Parvularcula bermudensis HTCC2503]|uniref:Beta-lactamase, putative n=1 Tax=Parvularcula bermudensis (strain ATCC BAA-594 / HTCC2503 / KCTC 12087) TaxID=314260 RepID=E0TBM0_PARBH|nr:hypothetical protein [Parvularcula bermudensis]ADM08395.1 beta-lactamase, putative [Parvularcula bermudensis HTCC2503]
MAFILGTSGNDNAVSTAPLDIFLGLGGDDVYQAGSGIDIALAGAGSDQLIGGAGLSIFGGGAGADLFTLAAGAGGTMNILDFEQGIDLIDLSEYGIKELAEIDVSYSDNGASVFVGDAVINLRNFFGDLTEEDFKFDVDTIDFEDITPADRYAPIPTGYNGFTWFNLAVIDVAAQDAQFPLNGYEANSGTNAMFNEFGGSASISRSANFDFDSFYASAAWNEGLQLEVSGYDDGVFIGSQTFTLSYDVSNFYELDDTIFDSVDQVEFSTFGGVDDPNDDGTGTQFSMDDLVIG